MVERHSSVPLSFAYPNAVQPDGNAAQQALAADRFAHEIMAILARGFSPVLISI